MMMKENNSESRKRTTTEQDGTEPAHKKRKTTNGSVTPKGKNILSLEPKHVYQILSFFSIEERLLTTRLVCKKLNELTVNSIEHLFLSEDQTEFVSIKKLVQACTKFPSLKSITLDGFDSLTDVALMEMVQKLPKSTEEIHVRECHLKNPRITSSSLKKLQFSLCSNLHTVRINSNSLVHLEFFNCEFTNTPKLNTPNLEDLYFYSCTNITNDRLENILAQFQPSMNENENLGFGNSQDSECRPIGGSTTHIDNGDSFTSPSVGRPENNNLKRLWLTECGPMQSPTIECDTLEDVRLINCQMLTRPVIIGSKITKIQLNWCENLQNLELGCENLKTIDLTGVGVNLALGSNSVYNHVREKITQSILQFFDNPIQVTY
eukprot:gb/GECH01013573.1/.p1 GENE.gb/GECH01013573.1/~~gb/GECH01013573.1/.p1  ORF type:complete len:377 (+),score=58.46 gb/GECH01013573.1/:1-1131(+)